MKKRIILILVLVLLGAGIFLFLTQKQTPVIRNTLSSRAQEYLNSRRTNTQTALKNSSINEDRIKTIFRNKTVTVGSCFTLMIPFRVFNTRKEGECHGYYAIDNPRGQIVVYQEKALITSFDEVPGVSMRRKFTDLYEEQLRVIHNRTYVIFRRKDQAYEKSAFSYTPESYFVLNLISGASDDLDAKLFAMLESLEFLK